MKLVPALPERPLIRLVLAVALGTVANYITIDSNGIGWEDLAIPFLKLAAVWLVVDEVVIRFRLAIARHAADEQRRQLEREQADPTR